MATEYLVTPEEGYETTWFEDRYDDLDDALNVAESRAGKLGCPCIVAEVQENDDLDSAIRTWHFDPWDGIWAAS